MAPVKRFHQVLLIGSLLPLGVAGIVAGLLLWHRLGWHFGLGKAKGQVSPGAAYGCLAALVLVASTAFLVGGE
jgi:hypothetical protein